MEVIAVPMCEQVEDTARGDDIRIGIKWEGDDYLLFWGNSGRPPNTNDLIEFALRHPAVVEELIRRGMSPQDLAADWEKKLGLLPGAEPVSEIVSVAEAEGRPTVLVLMPMGWEEISPSASLTALMHQCRGVWKWDVLRVRWQTTERKVLEVLMKDGEGARTLRCWIEELCVEGIWDAHVQFLR